MAAISISDLRISGADLFVDAETYLHELTDTELGMTKGGCFPIPTFRPTTNTITTITITSIVSKLV